MYYQSSAKPNDPSEPEVDRLKTLLDNLNHLRGKLKNFTVIDELGQPIGEISDLILDAGHQLNLVISQPDDQTKHPSVLLNGRRIKKVSVQTQSVFVDITKADVRFLPEYLLPGETETPAQASPTTEPPLIAMSDSSASVDDSVIDASLEPTVSDPVDDLFAEPEASPELELQAVDLVDWNQEDSLEPSAAVAPQDDIDFLGESLTSEESLSDLADLDLMDEGRSQAELSFSGLLEDPEFAEDPSFLSDSLTDDLMLETTDELSLGETDDSLPADTLNFDATPESPEELADFGMPSDFTASSEDEFDLRPEANSEAINEFTLSAEEDWGGFDQPDRTESTNLEEPFNLGSLGDLSNEDEFSAESSALPGFDTFDNENSLSDLNLPSESLPELSLGTGASSELGDLSGLELSSASTEDEWADFDRIVGDETPETETAFELGGLGDSSVDEVPASEEFSLAGFDSLDESESFELGDLESSSVDEVSASEEFPLAGFDSLGESESFELEGLGEPLVDEVPASEEFSLSSGFDSLGESESFELGDLESSSVNEVSASEEFSLAGFDSLDESESFELGDLESSSVDEVSASEEFPLAGFDSLGESESFELEGLGESSVDATPASEEFSLAGLDSLDESVDSLNAETAQPLPELDLLNEPTDEFNEISGLEAEPSLSDGWTGLGEVSDSQLDDLDSFGLGSSSDELTLQEEALLSEELTLGDEQTFGETFDNFSGLEVPQDETLTSSGLEFVDSADDLEDVSGFASIAVTPDDLTGFDLGLGDPDGDSLSFIETPDATLDDLPDENLSLGLEATNAQDDWELADLNDESETESTFDLGRGSSLDDLSGLNLTADEVDSAALEPDGSLTDTDSLDFSLESESLSDDQLGDFSTLDISEANDVTANALDLDLSGFGEITPETASLEPENLLIEAEEPDEISFIEESEEASGGFDFGATEDVFAEASSQPFAEGLLDDESLEDSLSADEMSSDSFLEREDTIGSLTDLTFTDTDQVESEVEPSFADENVAAEDASGFSPDSLPALHLPGLEDELAQMQMPLLGESGGFDAVSSFDSAAEESLIVPSNADSFETTSMQAFDAAKQPQPGESVEVAESLISTADDVDTIVPLLEEHLKVEYERRKIGEVVIRKRIMTRMVQVPVRYETLVIEQVGSEAAPLAEVDLSQGALDNIEVSGVSGKPTVSGEFQSPKTASYVLDAIAKTLKHRCKKVRIEIELEDESLQKAYQDWLDQCSKL